MCVSLTLAARLGSTLSHPFAAGLSEKPNDIGLYSSEVTDKLEESKRERQAAFGGSEEGYFQAANRAQVDAIRNLFGLPPSGGGEAAAQGGTPLAESLFADRPRASPPPLPSPELLWKEVFGPESERRGRKKDSPLAGSPPNGPGAAPSAVGGGSVGAARVPATLTKPAACTDAEPGCIQTDAARAKAARSGMMMPWSWPEGKFLNGARALQTASEQLTGALKAEGAFDIKPEKIDGGNAIRVTAAFGAGPLSPISGVRDTVEFILTSSTRTASFRAASTAGGVFPFSSNDATLSRNRNRLLRVRARLFGGRFGWECASPPELNPFAAFKAC